jgi:tetratricopeptide (TPR) repeat protein
MIDFEEVELAADALRDAYSDDAKQAVAQYEARLVHAPDATTRGRLHYEIARVCELVLGDLDRSAASYAQALAATPEHLPSIVGARRVALRQSKFDACLGLLDREIRLTADRANKAALLLAKGRLLEDRLGRPDAAREAYAAAIELSDPDTALWHAIAQIDAKKGSWTSLDRAYEAAANALAADPRLRAATLCQRARLKELHGNDVDGAAQLYAQAFELDPMAPGVVPALERMFAQRGLWRELVTLLEREASLVTDPASRALVLHRCALVWLERLGDRAAARTTLERAVEHGPPQAVVLEALARVYEDGASWPEYAATLAKLASLTDDPQQRLGQLHRLGIVCLDAQDDAAGAIAAFEAVLAIDPAHVPALRALAPLYTSAGRHQALVAMHQGEAAATRDPRRRAVAHARAAEILERIDRIEDAMAEHEHALALAPDLLPSFEALVRLYGDTDRHRQLVELYERHLPRVDVDRRIEYLFALGDIVRGPLDDAEQAEYAYRRILELRPSHLGAIHALGRVATGAGRWRTVIDALELEAGLVREPAARADLLHRAGEILDEKLARRDEAIAKLRNVLALDGRHPATLATLGRIFHAERRWADLAEVYARELDAAGDPTAEVILLHRLGELHARQLGDADQAVVFLRRALDLDPQHGPSLQLLTRIFRSRGSWKELVSLAELERDSFRDPSSRALASFQLGRIHEDHLDDLVGAERCYLQAVELRPGYRAAADALARARSVLGHWAELAAELERDAATLADPRLAVAALYRAGEVARDHLGDAVRARRSFERVLALVPDHTGALVALEHILRNAGEREALADVLATQAATFVDPSARVMALQERVRALDLAGLGTAQDRVDTWSKVLALRPGDPTALGGLERESLASGDARAIASVDALLAEGTADPQLRAAFLTRRAEALEASGSPQALEVYREALELDPESLGALRGLGRLAEVLGDAEAVVEVSEREAAVAKTPADAADAWVRAGVARIEHLADRNGAVAAFDRALALAPDHTDAATRLSATMRLQGQLAKLAERLGRAATEATNGDRQRALWLEVGQIYAHELDNLGAGVAALQRLLERHPKDVTALLELARLHLGDRRIDEAMALLARAVPVANGADLGAAHFLLGSAHEDKGDFAGAFAHYEMALSNGASEGHVLERVVALQLDTGLFGAAVDSATRLRERATDDEAAVRASVALAQAHIGGRRVESAIDALTDAIAIEGTGGIASSELHAIVTLPEHWRHYVDALRARLDQAKDRAAMYLEIARVMHERLEDVDGGRMALIEGLRACDGDAGLRFELANYLRLARRHAEAIEQLQQVLMDDVVRVEAWRSLAQTYDELGQPRARALANAALGVLEVATPVEREDLRTWKPRTDAIRPGALAGDRTSNLHVARDQQAPSAALLASIVEGLAKVRPADLARWGVSSRDKLTRPEGVRAIVDRIAALFAVEDYDVYQHALPDRGVFVDNTPRPTVLVPTWLNEASVAQQTYAITEAVVNLARGTFTIDLFAPRELDILLTAAVRGQVPAFGDRVAAPDVLDDHMRTITKAITRKRKRAYEIAAQAYASTRGPDTPTLVHWIRQSARRIALVVADDLPAGISVTMKSEGVAGKVGIAAVRASPVVADLLKVWAARPAMMLRLECGLFPGA